MAYIDKEKAKEITCGKCEKAERVNGILYCSASGKIIMPRFYDICLCRGKLKGGASDEG